MRPWTVMLDALADEDEFPSDRRRKNRVRRNLSGIVIAITDGDEVVEVSRVGFVRRNSRNPDTEFGEALEAEINKAVEAAEAINEWLDDRERALEERYLEVQDRVREIVGDPEGSLA